MQELSGVESFGKIRLHRVNTTAARNDIRQNDVYTYADGDATSQGYAHHGGTSGNDRGNEHSNMDTQILSAFPKAIREKIACEISGALEAGTREEHPGLQRVYCRRAAGEAIGELFRRSRRSMIGASAMSRLDAFAQDASLAPEVAEAAERLRAKQDETGERIMSLDPLEDLSLLLHYIAGVIKK